MVYRNALSFLWEYNVIIITGTITIENRARHHKEAIILRVTWIWRGRYLWAAIHNAVLPEKNKDRMLEGCCNRVCCFGRLTISSQSASFMSMRIPGRLQRIKINRINKSSRRISSLQSTHMVLLCRKRSFLPVRMFSLIHCRRSAMVPGRGVGIIFVLKSHTFPTNTFCRLLAAPRASSCSRRDSPHRR